MQDALQADYVIVGAGSAGCVLASRLTEDGRTRVILLEAGGDDRPLKEPSQFLSNVMIHVPIGYASTLKDPKVNWLFTTEPDPGTHGRTHVWPRGKVLGGSSSINAMLYIRGQRADYDGWRQLGCEGWGWDDVLPYFRRCQNQERGACDIHGVGGPLNVSDPTTGHEVSEAVIEACEALGLPRRDANGPDQEGVGWYQVTIKDGKRCSAAVAYLHPAMERSNLRVETRALASRVLFEGKRAVGVEFVQNGVTRVARASAEIILAGGTINSPQLLQLSGIGPAALLREYGIDVLADVPGVGENLQDHFVIGETFRLRKGVASINELVHGTRFLRETLKYMFGRKGLLTLSAAHVAVFCKSREGLAGPDIQFHILPATMDPDKLANSQKMELEKEPGLTIAPCQLRPESRGTIRIRSPDPSAYPAIQPNYLSDRLDQEVIVAGLRWGRRMAEQPALARYIERELLPGPEAVTDEQLLEHARIWGTTIYHPVGTCAMGHGPGAVVDPQLRVHGVEGLRVVDASVMPRLVSGNTNAPTIMIAEKASDMIRGKAMAAAA
ncbi:MAG TPA: GMC family oxidoreductase N-terminal domain-containing protein [Allosphingosinicella sp.]|nr:GMC family oxidoreductase N-terminal domain-containing protein [Allosphingosinicella sp.]